MIQYCYKCKSENIVVSGNLMLSFPIKYYAQLTKKAISTKEVKMLGFDWDNAKITCLDCGTMV